MSGLRQFVRSGRSSQLLALWLAYSLAIQALMASVGFGMSAFAAAGPSSFVFCSHVSEGVALPAGGSQAPKRTPPSCPFCFIAAQSGGHDILVGQAPALPAYVDLQVASLEHRVTNRIFVARFRRVVGDPRGPPTFSA
jgi:hypothetical protein